MLTPKACFAIQFLPYSSVQILAHFRYKLSVSNASCGDGATVPGSLTVLRAVTGTPIVFVVSRDQDPAQQAGVQAESGSCAHFVNYSTKEEQGKQQHGDFNLKGMSQQTSAKQSIKYY